MKTKSSRRPGIVVVGMSVAVCHLLVLSAPGKTTTAPLKSSTEPAQVAGNHDLTDPPPPMQVGPCAYEYMGESNGVHYYTTCACISSTPDEPFSFGQSAGCLTPLGCMTTGGCHNAVETDDKRTSFPMTTITDAHVFCTNTVLNSPYLLMRQRALELYPFVHAALTEYNNLPLTEQPDYRLDFLKHGPDTN